MNDPFIDEAVDLLHTHLLNHEDPGVRVIAMLGPPDPDSTQVRAIADALRKRPAPTDHGSAS